MTEAFRDDGMTLMDGWTAGDELELVLRRVGHVANRPANINISRTWLRDDGQFLWAGLDDGSTRWPGVASAFCHRELHKPIPGSLQKPGWA
ncbi:hypothetical protein E2P81_ATG07098 [Venturia nashicola]|nr:hypothetical protein E2P81_ATG07098 [Venturia nashicola]